MVHFISLFEILQFYEKLDILQDKWEHHNLWNLLESNPTTILFLFYINLCNSGGYIWCFITINKFLQAYPLLLT